MALFMDPLDIYLMILGATLLGSAYLVWVTVISKIATEGLKALSLYYISVGILALATGVWGIATWPLPSSYNIVLIDPWALFGAAALMIGLALYFTGSLSAVSVPLAFLGVIPIVYGADILKYGLTTEPGMAAALYILTGLAPVLSPFAYLYGGKGVNKYIGYLIIILLIIAGIIAYIIGVGAAFEHTAGWAKWTPWYG